MHDVSKSGQNNRRVLISLLPQEMIFWQLETNLESGEIITHTLNIPFKFRPRSICVSGATEHKHFFILD